MDGFGILIYLSIFTLTYAWVDEYVFHTNKELETSIDLLVKYNPDIFIKQHCPEDNRIKIVKTNQSLLLHQNNSKKYISAIAVCNEHAREIITAQACLEFLKKLALSENRKMLGFIKFNVIYNANPVVREKIFQGHYCMRRDQNGIDLNRNFPFRFDSTTSPQSLQYAGKHPLSQNYSQCLDKLATKQLKNNSKNVINTFLSIHSGQFSFYLPKCNSTSSYQKQFNVLAKVREKFCSNWIFRETSSGSDGNSFQDMKCRKNFDYTTTIQIYGGSNKNLNARKQCWIIFNPTTADFYYFTVNRSSLIMIQYHKQILKAEITTKI